MTQALPEGHGIYRSVEHARSSPREKLEKILKGKTNAVVMSAYGPAVLHQYDGEIRVHILYAYPRIEREHTMPNGKTVKDTLKIILTVKKDARDYSRVEGTFEYGSDAPVPPDFDPEKLLRTLGMETPKIVDYSIDDHPDRRKNCIEETKKIACRENVEYPELYSGMTVHGFCQIEIQPQGQVVHLEQSPPATFYIDNKGRCLNMVTEKKIAGSWVDWNEIGRKKTPFTQEKIIRRQYTRILDEALETMQSKPVERGEQKETATEGIIKNIRGKLNL